MRGIFFDCWHGREQVDGIDIAKEFFEPTIVDGYTVRRETKEVWAINLDLLEVFQKFCEAHGLRYFMGFGTLLGAFRHGGFVPWDDDVDLLMPRADFERLKSLAGEISEPYFLQHAGNDKGFWHRGMMKFRNSDTTCIERRHLQADFNQGIALEILPLDHVPDDAVLRQQQSMRNSILQRLLWAKLFQTDYQLEDDHGAVKKRPAWKWYLYRLAAGFVSAAYLQNKLFENWMKYNAVETKYCAIYTNYGGKVKLFHTEDFSDRVWMDFENLRLPAPNGFWRCLEKHYGKEFLRYLPLEQRKPHHPAYWDAGMPYRESYDRLRNVFQHTEGKTIVLFGTGNMVLDYEKRTAGKYRPDFFVDNNAEKWGTMYRGIPVKPPQELLNISPDKLHLVICNNYFREIGKQLQGMGIQHYFIYSDNPDVLFGNLNDIGEFSSGWKKPYKIGYVESSFAILDATKVQKLEQMKLKCDYLIAGLLLETDDVFSRRYRLEMLQSISYVDLAILVHKEERDCMQKKYHIDKVFEF